MKKHSLYYHYQGNRNKKERSFNKKVDIESEKVDIEGAKVDIRNKIMSFSDRISEKQKQIEICDGRRA